MIGGDYVDRNFEAAAVEGRVVGARRVAAGGRPVGGGEQDAVAIAAGVGTDQLQATEEPALLQWVDERHAVFDHHSPNRVTPQKVFEFGKLSPGVDA